MSNLDSQGYSNQGASGSQQNRLEETNKRTSSSTVGNQHSDRTSAICLVCRLRNSCIIFGYVVLLLHTFDIARFLYRNNKGGSYLNERLVLTVKLPLKMLNIAFIIILLAGLHEKKPQYARFYLLFCLMYLIFIASFTVYNVIYERKLDTFEICYYCGIFVASFLMTVGFVMYYLFVLRNYYAHIYEETKELPVNVMLARSRVKISSTFLLDDKMYHAYDTRPRNKGPVLK